MTLRSEAFPSFGALEVKGVWRWVALIVCGLAFLACRQDMHDAPRLDALEASDFFADGMASRPLPEGTVARGFLREDSHLYEGKTATGEFVDAFPMEVTREVLLRGQERYEIYCSVCHDSTGGGSGMIVRRGFKAPPPLHEQRLVELPEGYFFDVITHGFGLMSSYAKQVSVEDRWAIVAYIRVLQLRRTAQLGALPSDLQQEFHAAANAAASEPAAHGGDHPEPEESHHE